jgi:hypothetical protein
LNRVVISELGISRIVTIVESGIMVLVVWLRT